MQVYTDQTGRTISLQRTPQHIISLVPSQTELLFDLDLDEEVAGITKFCIHPPEWFYTKPRVGGTKKLHVNLIHELQPDLVIANKEENVKEQIEELADHYPVWVSDVKDLESAIEMIEQIGLLTSRKEKAESIVGNIKKNFSQLPIPNNKPLTAYLIWNSPYMAAGGDTFIHCMMEAAGFENVFAGYARYPEITVEELKDKNAELLLLSSEPFPFKQKHIDELRPVLDNIGLMNSKITLVDGEMFSWYGSRLQYAPSYFMELQEKLFKPH
jgi:ABC-type Fe3+-hydroxamate transport system substrate-binding protein